MEFEIKEIESEVAADFSQVDEEKQQQSPKLTSSATAASINQIDDIPIISLTDGKDAAGQHTPTAAQKISRKRNSAGYLNDRHEMLCKELPTKTGIEHTNFIENTLEEKIDSLEALLCEELPTKTGIEHTKIIENTLEEKINSLEALLCKELPSKTGIEHTKIIRNTLEERINSLEANQKIILENQQTILHNIVKLQENNLNGLSQIAAVLEKLLKKNSMVEVDAVFPIKSWEQLKDIDELCRNDANRYIQCIKTIVSPEGIEKNFHRLLDRKLIQLLNYDGVSNKAPFKDFAFLNSAIFEAIKSEGYTNKEYVRDIRNSFKLYKNLYYKKRYEERKKNKNQE